MKYFWSTLKHKWFVFLAGFRVGLPLWQAITHDLSKFLKTELLHYDRQFFGDKGDQPGFAVAWLHHQNCNPHHWEYWITRSDHSKGASEAVGGCLPMPERYVREMVADWMGASKAYTGSWDMSEWLSRNLAGMKLHPMTLQHIESVLEHLNYHCHFDRFANMFRVEISA